MINAAGQLPVEEQERLLIKASSDYMRGRITAEELHRVEQEFQTDYLAAARSIARNRTRSVNTPKRRSGRLWRLIRRIWTN